MSDQPLIYLILGASGSERREVVADLIDGGLGAGDRAAVLLAEHESEMETAGQLPATSRWGWTAEGGIRAELPAGATHVFFVTDGRRDPVDQIEAFKAWLDTSGGELGRVLCVVNCQLAEKHHALRAWFDACIHFADVVLLTRREGVANKWVSDFTAHFKGMFTPSVFEMVKHGRVKNPALILEPQARRMSHLFDADQDWVFTDTGGEVIEEGEDEAEGEQEVTATPEVDPYLERRPGGRRVKVLPDIAAYLGEDPPPGDPASSGSSDLGG